MRMKPFGLSAFMFVAMLGTAAAASAVGTMLDWTGVTWNPGDLKRTYTLGDADVTIEVSSLATGTFTTWNGTTGTGSTVTPCGAGPAGCCVATPGKDGTGQSTNFFGTQLDLGVIFEPGSGDAGNLQPVLIKLKFTNAGSGEFGPLKPVDTLNFEISDIDWAGGGPYSAPCTTLGSQGWRRDRVVVTADNNGSPVTAFTITPKTAQPASAVIVSPANTVTAEGTADNGAGIGTAVTVGSDNGSVVVAFGASLVTDVLLTYSESAYGLACTTVAPGCVGGVNVDPGFRGIGVLGLTMRPVGLMEFTIE